jgi:hypothetical protein
MTTLVELLTYMIASAGITNIVVYGSIFDRIRPKKRLLGKLFHCPMCLGTWVGFALCGLAGWTEMFNIEPTLMNYALCGGISSLAAYTYAMIISDEGLNINSSGRQIYITEDPYDEEHYMGKHCKNCITPDMVAAAMDGEEPPEHILQKIKNTHQGGGNDQQ